MKFIELRKKIGTQEKFALLVGTTKFSVSRWEQGESLPKTKDLRKIAKVCGVTVDELLKSFD